MATTYLAAHAYAGAAVPGGACHTASHTAPYPPLFPACPTPPIAPASVPPYTHLGPAKSDSGRAPGEAAPLGLLGAAQRGDLAQLRRALAACPGSPDSIKDGDGCTALHLACAQGCAQAAHLLIRAGASVWCKTDAGRKPLHFAASGGHVEVMKLLLEASCSGTWAGASPFSKDDLGTTPLHLAAEGGHAAAVRVLLGVPGASTSLLLNAKLKASRRKPLHSAAAGGYATAVHALLEAGASLKSKDSSGNSPLHLAVAACHAGVVQLLLGCGAEVDPKNDNLETPLLALVAAWPGALDRAQFAAAAAALLGRGADPEAPNRDGLTPRALAAQLGVPLGFAGPIPEF